MIKNKKIKYSISILIICLIPILYYCFTVKHSTKPNYITTAVRKGDIEDSVLATGSISALKTVSVGSQATGQIKTLKVKLGQKLKKGDLIAEIDSETQKDSLKDAQSSLENYEAQLASKKVTLEKDEIKYNRQTEMFKSQATSQENVDDAKITLEQAKADVIQIQTQISQAKNAVNTAQVNLSYTKISSPIDGVIVSIPVTEGQTVNAVQSSPTIVEIAQLETVIVKPEIAESDVIRVKPGMPLYFTILGDGDKKYYSTLKSIDPGPKSLSDNTSTSSSTSSSSSSDSSSGIYYYGLFEIPNPDGRFRISMTAQVSIVLASAHDALIIPSNAVKKDSKGNQTVSILDKKGKIIKQEVKIGIDNNIDAQILSGLSDGQEIILTQSDSTTTTSNQQPHPPMRM
jgi:membrane fusion protein, macrolide-specific efflux system